MAADGTGGEVPAVRAATDARYPWHAVARTSPSPAAALPGQGERAGVVTRLVANGLDALVVAVVLVGMYLAVAAVDYMLAPKGFRFPAPAPGFALGVALLVEFVYLTLAWTLDGRTYGDQVMGLRVIGATGRRLGLATSAVRAAFCTVVPIGLLWVAVSRHNRSLQDVVLRTSVVYDWAPAATTPRPR